MNIAKICLLTSFLWFLPTTVLAQVTPDGSTSTTVNTDGNISTIDAGEQAGANLFHSFSDFSVPNGGEAYFNNSADIENILSRVTGGNVSNIDGLISANNANLFLINPAGVILGDGARLDLGGSFYGGTADSILFPDGVEFNANNTNTPVLTINAPIGLNLRDNPADVNVQSSNLTVSPGQDLSLVGGNINLDGANINALGSQVNLTALSTAGTVNFNENLDFSNVTLADISLSNGATVNVNGDSGGVIAVNARNLTLSEASILSAGINSETSTLETQAGNITINVSDNVALESGSVIRNNISEITSGNAGDIQITAKNLSLADESKLSSISEGNGNTGNINLEIADQVILARTGEIKTQISPNTIGDSGDINLNATTLTLSAGSSLFTNVLGQGDAGNINIATSDRIILDSSNLQTQVSSGATGNAGDINLTTNSLLLSNNNSESRSQILANTRGIGDAGDITVKALSDVSLEDNSFFLTSVATGSEGRGGNIEITTTNLSLTGESQNDRASLLSDSKGIGDAGNITINASGDISLKEYGLIASQATEGRGNAGDININADGLFLNTGSYIISNTGDIILPISSNVGDAGNININSRIIALNNFSEITSNSLNNAEGKAGNVSVDTDKLTIAGGSNINALTENSFDGGTIDINAQNIELITGGKIVTGTNSEGNAGNIILNVTEEIKIDGKNAPVPTEELRFLEETLLGDLELSTGLFANTTSVSNGNGGSIEITSPEVISLFNSGQIAVDSQGTGNGGNLSIQAGSINLDNQSQLISETQVGQEQQQPSNINLKLDDVLSLQGDSKISAQAFNNANGGNITIDADFVVAFPTEGNGNDIIANAREGSGGSINISAQQIFGIEERASETANETNDLDVSSEFGFDGSLSINTPDVNPTEGIRDLPVQAIAPEENVQQVCNANNPKGGSNLSFKGKGGIPIEPIEPLSSDNILLPKQPTTSQTGDPKPATQTEQYPPIITAQGKIYPARDLVVTDAGEVILTRSPQQNTSQLPQTNDCLTDLVK
jgi:filamentous hemagglutinin family protein